MITLKQMHYALELENTLHFRKAAEKCFVASSTLSSAIMKLELQLGRAIFERTNKRVLITPFGHIFLQKARAVIESLEEIQKFATGEQPPLNGHLRVGVIPTVGPYLLPVVLPELRDHYPLLELTIVEGTSSTLVSQLKEGALDTAILALPYTTSDLLAFKFWQEDFYLISHTENGEADHGEIDASQIDPSELMLLEEGHCLTGQALDLCKITNDQVIDVGAASLMTLVGLVDCKLGSTLAPEIALPYLVSSNPTLRAQRLNEVGPHRELALLVRANYSDIASVVELQRFFSRRLEMRFAAVR